SAARPAGRAPARMGAVLVYALARVRAHPGRSLLAACGIVAASAMLGAALTVATALGGGFDRAASRANLADVIARFDNAPGGVVRDRASSLPNVRALAQRYISTNVELRAPGHDTFNATLEGIVPGPRGYAVVQGRDLGRAPGEALVERGLARAWRIHVGSPIVVG